jgi:hypothetical protein
VAGNAVANTPNHDKLRDSRSHKRPLESEESGSGASSKMPRPDGGGGCRDVVVLPCGANFQDEKLLSVLPSSCLPSFFHLCELSCLCCAPSRRDFFVLLMVNTMHATQDEQGTRVASSSHVADKEVDVQEEEGDDNHDEEGGVMRHSCKVKDHSKSHKHNGDESRKRAREVADDTEDTSAHSRTHTHAEGKQVLSHGDDFASMKRDLACAIEVIQRQKVQMDKMKNELAEMREMKVLE